jgi:hypothetical protein
VLRDVLVGHVVQMSTGFWSTVQRGVVASGLLYVWRGDYCSWGPW